MIELCLPGFVLAGIALRHLLNVFQGRNYLFAAATNWPRRLGAEIKNRTRALIRTRQYLVPRKLLVFQLQKNQTSPMNNQ